MVTAMVMGTGMGTGMAMVTDTGMGMAIGMVMAGIGGMVAIGAMA